MTEPASAQLVPSSEFLGKYRIIKKLASGGMAQVFLAVIEGPEDFSKLVVIKTVLPEFEDVVDFNTMFIREARLAALLSHPNIVQVYDFGKVENRYFLAMEWIDGVSLQQLMRRAAKCDMRLGPKVAVTVGLALCEALAYVQSLVGPDGAALGIVHRDVTPENVLIANSTGIVKLTDFGVVKTAAFPSCTQGGEIKGKFDYMSPEQLQNLALDGRSDVYAVGIVLYEVATGRRLFKRPVLAKTFKAILENEVPKPSSICPDLPLGLEEIILKALATNREDRYAGAREMLADLESFKASARWTASSRELASLVGTLFPPGERGTNSSRLLTNSLLSKALGSASGASQSAQASQVSQSYDRRTIPPVLPSARVPINQNLPIVVRSPEPHEVEILVEADETSVDRPSADRGSLWKHFGLQETILLVAAVILLNIVIWLYWF